MTDYVPKTFNIIKHHGTPREATLDNGRKVYRQEKLFIREWGRFVVCADYSDHFVFEVPVTYKDMPSFQCTCGSFACIVGANIYAADASPTASGEMMICYHHATYGVHATGGSKWA